MIPEYKNKAYLLIALVIVLLIVAAATAVNAMRSESSGLITVAYIARVGGGIAFIWGCCMYAKAKGYSAVLGLLGLLFLIGLIVLAVLPDKAK
jgi:hypothetical protein